MGGGGEIWISNETTVGKGHSLVLLIVDYADAVVVTHIFVLTKTRKIFPDATKR